MELTKTHIHCSKHHTFKRRKVEKYIELLKEERVHKEKNPYHYSICFHVNFILNITSLGLINLVTLHKIV